MGSLKDKNFGSSPPPRTLGGLAVADLCMNPGRSLTPGLIGHTPHDQLALQWYVPAGVWIATRGQQSSAPEVSYQEEADGSYKRSATIATVGVRDWVEKGGALSDYVMPAGPTGDATSPCASTASCASRRQSSLGAISSEKEPPAGTLQLDRSQELNPNWNSHGRTGSFDKSKEMTNCLAKVRKLCSKPY